jgi:hypothetical protein
MQYLGLLFSLALLATNFWGLLLVIGFYWRCRWFALATGPLIGVTAVYAIECHHGLGPSLSGMCVATTIMSAALIAMSLTRWEPGWLGDRMTRTLRGWRSEFALGKLIPCFAVFGAIFLYALAWRFTYPDIDGSSEKIADLSYICSYYSGETLPAPDAWFSPYRSTQYYSFQHYGAALMGRLLSLPTGTAYNLAFCVLIALGGTAFAGAVCLAARKAWVRALLILGFIFGGMGMSVLVHLTDRAVSPLTSMRFVGSAPMDKPPFGPWLKGYERRFTHLELPAEPFSYSIQLGDYHAPLSGYYLLGVGAMAILLWSRSRQRRYAAVAGATLTWTLLANPWVLPLQGLGVAAWLAASHRDWRRLVPAVALGAALVWLAAWVFLAEFTASAAGYNTSLKWVGPAEHTAPLEFVLVMLPTVGLVALSLFSGTVRGLRLGLLWLGFLVFVECFYVSDIYSGEFLRFNTSLKWWPWVAAGALMTLGPVVLEAARFRWVRIAGVVLCLYPCFYAYDLWQPFRNNAKDAVGKIEGTHYLTKDEFPRLLLDRLKVEKRGVAVERPDTEGGFVNSSVLPLFAGQRMWLGWFGHEGLWRGYRSDISRRHDVLLRFYGGQMPDAGSWLAAQGIDYVLWFRPGDTPELWPKVNASIGPGYAWCDILTYPEAGHRVGFWKRLPGSPP